MGKKSGPPPAPDYTAAANAQAGASQSATANQTAADRPNVTTPWGTQTWNSTAGVDPSTGKPVTNWATDIKLSPDQQSALDSQMRVQHGLSTGAEGLIGQATDSLGKPMDWSSLPQSADRVGGLPGTMDAIKGQMNSTAGDWRQKAQSAVEGLQAPQLAQRREMIQTQLANQGIAPGSEAYSAAMRDLGDEENRAGLSAIAAGRDEANSMFGQDLASSQFANQAQGQEFGQGLAAQGADINAGSFNNQNRQQAISEGQLQRNQPLNALNALLTGQQVGNPQMPNFTPASKAETPQLLNAAGMQYQGQLDQSNAGQSGLTGLMSGLFGLGGAAMGGGGWGGLFSLGGGGG